MAKSRNPLKDLSDLTEMSVVKNWIDNTFTVGYGTFYSR